MIELKREPYVLGLYVVVIAAGTYLLSRGVVTWRELEIFLGSGALMPALVGLRGTRTRPQTAATEAAVQKSVGDAAVPDTAKTDPPHPPATEN